MWIKVLCAVLVMTQLGCSVSEAQEEGGFETITFPAGDEVSITGDLYAPHEDKATPVSYTHLTLPTIYSV